MLRLRYSLLVVILAFLVNVMLPFFATYSLPVNSSESLTKTQLSSLFGDKILICTENGFEWVSIKDIESGKVPDTHSDIKCPVCFVAGNNHKALGSSGHFSLAYAPYSNTVEIFQLVSFSFNHFDFKESHPTRAPPYSFKA